MLKLDSSQQVEQEPASSRIILVGNTKMKLGLQSRVLNQQGTIRVRVTRLVPLLAQKTQTRSHPLVGKRFLMYFQVHFHWQILGRVLPAGLQTLGKLVPTAESTCELF